MRSVQAEAKRKAVEERLDRNMKMAAKIEEKRKVDFFAKQEHHEQLRSEHTAAMERDRLLAARQQDLMEQRRLMVLAQTRRDEERRREALRQSFADEEVNVQRVKEARERHHMLVKEKKNLQTAMKLENVHRIKRIGEYTRLETLRQIHEGDKRIEQMLKRKGDIVEQRKMNAQSVKIAKDNLLKVMEDARANGNKASKLIKEFMAPPSSDLLGSSSGSGGGGGDAGAAKKKKKKLALGRSAAPGPSSPLGPKPSAGSGLERRLDPSAGNQPPLPYVSPYDLPADPSLAATVTF